MRLHLLILALALCILPAQAQRNRVDRAPEVGSEAPDFELATLADPEVLVQLSSFVGEKPVILIFGSYT